MAALVEVHDQAELEMAFSACDPGLVGINNRNLRDFSVHLETTLSLRPLVPAGVCMVAEVGIHTAADVERLREAGVDAILVGEALVTAADTGGQSAEPGAMIVKICGITTLEDALAGIEAGADWLGFNFYPPSPRYISPRRPARRSPRRCGGSMPEVKLVGVFVDAPVQEVTAILRRMRPGPGAAVRAMSRPSTCAMLGERAFKALRPADARRAGGGSAAYPARSEAPAWLVDAYRPGAVWRDGQTADWSLAAGLAQRAPILLAGGLTPGERGRGGGAGAPVGRGRGLGGRVARRGARTRR